MAELNTINIDQAISGYKRTEGDSKWPYIYSLSDISQRISQHGRLKNDFLSVQQATLFKKLIKLVTDKENAPFIGFTSFCDTLDGIVKDSWDKEKKNKLVVPMIISLIATNQKEYDDKKEFLSTDIYFTAAQILKEYGTKYQLSDNDGIKLGDFLFEKISLTNPYQEEHLFRLNAMPFNAFVESVEKQKTSSKVKVHLFSDAQSEKALDLIHKFEGLKIETTQSLASERFNVIKQKTYYQTMYNLMKLVQD